MKIKLSKTGHPTIVTTTDQKFEAPVQASTITSTQTQVHTNEDSSLIKALKKSHLDITLEALKDQHMDSSIKDLHSKRKEMSIAPIEIKKVKMESDLKKMFPDVSIQPVAPAVKPDHHAAVLESKRGISQQQMNVIKREISITQVARLLALQLLNKQISIKLYFSFFKVPSTPSIGTTLFTEHLKSALPATSEATPLLTNNQVIQPARPELVLVNEGSNSSQDVMIIEEVPPPVKIPKKRGRPRKTENLMPGTAAVAAATAAAASRASIIKNFTNFKTQQDPLSLDSSTAGADGTERPKRTCRLQKSYAPPKRGRGRGSSLFITTIPSCINLQ